MNSLTLSVLTFNTFSVPIFSRDIKQRLHKFSEIVNSSSLDILCLQEVLTFHQVKLLKNSLPDFPYVEYKRHLYGPKGGLVIFSRLPLKSSSFIDFSDRGPIKNLASIGAKIIKNGILLTQLRDHPVCLLTTHFTTNFDFDWSLSNKSYSILDTQADEVINITNQLARQNAVIVTGDFNIGKNSPLYYKMLKDTSAIDAFADQSFPTYDRDRLFFIFRGKKSDRIDYIFLTDHQYKTTIVTTKHLFNEKQQLSNQKVKYLSDHIGLQVTVSIEEKRKSKTN